MWTQRHAYKDNACKREGGDGVILLQVKEHQRWPANHQKQGYRHEAGSLSALRSNQSCRVPALRPQDFKTGNNKSCCSSQPVCDILLCQP